MKAMSHHRSRDGVGIVDAVSGRMMRGGFLSEKEQKSVEGIIL